MRMVKINVKVKKATFFFFPKRTLGFEQDSYQFPLTLVAVVYRLDM